MESEGKASLVIEYVSSQSIASTLLVKDPQYSGTANEQQHDGRISVCPFGPTCSQSTIVDDSDEFPEPLDPLGRLTENPEPKKAGFVKQYVHQCFMYGVTPIGTICEVLEAVERNPEAPVVVDLNRYGSSNLQAHIALDMLARACPNVLENLNLSFNLLMSEPVANALSNLLQVAQKITELNLSHSTLNDRAMAALAEAFSTSSIRKMILTNCHISDSAGADLFRKLIASDTIQELDLSWNRLEYQSGSSAALFLQENKFLQDLNLEGNFLYLEKECIVPLLRELSKNETLKRLNLAWNALGGQLFAQSLPRALINSAVEVFNLQMNCMRTDEALVLCRALVKTESLRELYIGGNFFKQEEIKDMVKMFGRNPNVKVLSLGDYQFVNKVAARLAKRCMNKDPSKSVSYQGILLSNPPRTVDVQEMLLNRCRYLGFKPKKKKRKRDLGHFMLQLQGLEDHLVERDDFKAMVKKFRIKLDRSLLESLMDTFADKRLVDTAAMAAKYLSKYPTEPPLSKKASKKGGKKKKNGKKIKF